MASLHAYPDDELKARALADTVADRLAAAIAARGSASLVVSGGKSPVPFFQALSRHALDWPRVWVTLADERWVDAGSPDSNEALVKRHLAAPGMHFVSLKTADAEPPLAALTAALDAMPRPFDAVVLGMGEDGHTASLFPGAAGLERAMDPAAPPAVVAITPPAAPHRRVTLNLAALLDARMIYVSVQGAAKRAIIDAPAGLPIAAVLSQARVPVHVYWSP